MNTSLSPMATPESLTEYSDEAYTRFDPVDDRDRPMTASVQYYGRVSEDKRVPTVQEMYKMTAGQIRKLCHVYDLDGMAEEFVEQASSHNELTCKLRIQGMSEERIAEIVSIIEDGDTAPKFTMKDDNQLSVVVSYADGSTKNKVEEPLAPAQKKPSMHGFGG